MPLPDCLRLPTPRQPTPEVRSGRAYRDFSAVFIVLLTVAIVLFVLPFVLPPRWHWPLWIAAAGVIVLTAPLRARGIHRGLLSHYAHGTAVEGTVAAAEDAGGGTWRLRVRYDAPGGPVERDFLVYDAPEAPLRPGESVPVLHRPGNPKDAVLPTLAGLLG